MDLPIADGASLEAKSDVVCDHRRRRQMWVAWRSGLPGTWTPGVHANCGHNERAALLMRSLAPNPLPDGARLGAEFRAVFGRLRGLARAYCGTAWSYLETAESYSGRLRRRYLEAERSLRVDGPLGPADTLLRAFLKAEKLSVAKFQKPRMIFPRSPRYNLVLASWLKPFEHWLWGYLTAVRLFGGSNTRVVAKGLSPRQRANLIVRKFNNFKRCVVFEADAKAFEAHVSSVQISLEHSVYLAAYGGRRALKDVLSRQVFRGVTPTGLKFSRLGGRASGDFNTGMGNTLIMLAAIVGSLRTYGVKFDCLVDGDNALVFLEQGDVGRVVDSFSELVLAQSGHELTLEKPVAYLEGVRFGRSAPVFLGRGLGWTMVREPEAVLSTALASHRHLREPSFGRRWLNGVARCELSLARGLPVLQAWALQVLRTTATLKKLPVDEFREYFVVGAWLAGEEACLPVEAECRLSFERAFGWSPEEQLRFEVSVPGVGPSWPTCDTEYPDARSWTLHEHRLTDGYWDAHV
jgi:hypothetical protein